MTAIEKWHREKCAKAAKRAPKPAKRDPIPEARLPGWCERCQSCCFGDCRS